MQRPDGKGAPFPGDAVFKETFVKICIKGEARMWKCFFMKRKLYDFLESELPQHTRDAIAEHLDRCTRCQGELEAIKSVIALARKKDIPAPSSDFWQRFSAELDNKLNKRLVGPAVFKRSPVFLPRPALSFALILTVFLIGVSFYVQHAKYEHLIIHEAANLDDVTPNPEFSPLSGADGIMDDIRFLYKLGVDPAS